MAVVWRLPWPRIFCTVGRLIPFCKDVVANVCRSTCGLASLVIPARLATALKMSLARRLLTGNASSALDPELALLPEDVFRGEGAKLADAEPGVEQGPDDEPLGGRLAGIGQTIRFFGSKRFSHVLIRHLSPRNSCVFGV